MTPAKMRRAYLREAAVMLGLARLAVRFVSSARLFAWADRPVKTVRRFTPDDATWVDWAVDTVASRRRMTAQCLPRALAAHAMLRRRGIVSTLCLGVARDGTNFAAHAWIEVGGKRLVGGDEADAFTRLAAFGGVK